MISLLAVRADLRQPGLETNMPRPRARPRRPPGRRPAPGPARCSRCASSTTVRWRREWPAARPGPRGPMRASRRCSTSRISTAPIRNALSARRRPRPRSRAPTFLASSAPKSIRVPALEEAPGGAVPERLASRTLMKPSTSSVTRWESPISATTCSAARCSAVSVGSCRCVWPAGGQARRARGASPSPRRPGRGAALSTCRERLLGPERTRVNSALTRSACVWQREPGAQALIDHSQSSRRVPGPAAIASGSPGLILITSAPGSRAVGHRPVLGLGGLDHQPRDAVGGRRLEQGPHGLGLACPGGAADEHVPVERVRRQDERAGRAQVPVEDLAQLDACAARPAPASSELLRGVTSKSGRSASRTPGTSDSRRPRERGQQLGRAVERRGRDGVAAGSSSAGVPSLVPWLLPGAAADPGAPAPGSERVRQSLRSADAQQQPGDAGRARLVHVPPAAMVIRHGVDPVDRPRCSSAWRSLSRRAWAAVALGKPVGRPLGDPLPEAAISSDSARSSAGVTGFGASTSQPNGPVQLPSSPSSSESPARPGAPPAAQLPARSCHRAHAQRRAGRR